MRKGFAMKSSVLMHRDFYNPDDYNMGKVDRTLNTRNGSKIFLSYQIFSLKIHNRPNTSIVRFTFADVDEHTNKAAISPWLWFSNFQLVKQRN